MSDLDIFISYASRDQAKIAVLARALDACGWSVWWDPSIRPGEIWHEVIEAHLTTARCVIVAWSQASCVSRWVLEEADEGLARGVLAPVLLEPVRPPLGYRRIEAADLSRWNGDPSQAEFPILVDRLTSLLGPTRARARTQAETKDVPTADQSKAPVLTGRQPVRQTIPRNPGEIFRDRLADGSEGPEMVVIPAGSFWMGSPDADTAASRYERPQHEVVIEKPFALGRYAVTFEEYDRFAAASGAELPHDKEWGRGSRPVINVSWDHAVVYAAWLSEQTGQSYRLPTEAEWEYAARAGTQPRYWWGDEPGKGRANFDTSGSKWSGSRTAPVDAFDPNGFGLFQMLGNVWEWTADCWHESFENAPKNGRAWEMVGRTHCGRRVTRGGSWHNDPQGIRSSVRFWSSPVTGFDDLGFRLAQNL